MPLEVRKIRNRKVWTIVDPTTGVDESDRLYFSRVDALADVERVTARRDALHARMARAFQRPTVAPISSGRLF